MNYLKLNIQNNCFCVWPVTKRIALRQTGPNEYVYRDTGYKVNVDNNNDWYCGECGAQRKNRVSMATHIRSSHIFPGKPFNLNLAKARI